MQMKKQIIKLQKFFKDIEKVEWLTAIIKLLIALVTFIKILF